MAYQKQNFTDGQVLTAEHLNHIEEGISAMDEVVLIDTSTQTKYVLYVNNGELRIREVNLCEI